MGTGDINKPLALPFDWVTACPCGTEYIKLLAQSTPFEPLNVSSKDGFDYITEDLTDVLNKTRGFQKDKQNDEGFYFGESGFSITTLPVSN